MIRLTEGQRAAGRWALAQRNRLGLNQDDVAHSAGISPTSIRQFELGRSWPRTSTRQAIERELKMNEGDLAEYAYWYDQELEQQPSMSETIRVAQRTLQRMAEQGDAGNKRTSD